MEVIKIHTTPSTNDFLKERLRQDDVTDGTVIWALHQTQGRGQRGNIWLAESGKNLTFSILKKWNGLEAVRQFDLNKLVSVAVAEALENYVPEVFIKWPNDILSADRKLCGILIENTLQGMSIKNSIIGIGINVNQERFDDLPFATSLKKRTGKDFDLEDVLATVLKNLDYTFASLETMSPDTIQQKYRQYLYAWDTWKTYQTPNNAVFEGKTLNVTQDGKLELLNRQGEKLFFEMQEVKMMF